MQHATDALEYEKILKKSGGHLRFDAGSNAVHLAVNLANGEKR